MASKTDKMPWGEAWRLNVRAIKLLNSKNRLMFPYFIINALLGTASSYTSLFAMSRLIGELSGDRRVEKLAFWAVFSIASTAVFAIINGIMTNASEVKAVNFWNNIKRIEDEKLMSMDYSDVEDQRVRDLRDQIWENQNWMGWGFPMMAAKFETLVLQIFSILGAVALASGLIISKVSEKSQYSFLNSPLAVIGFMILIFLCAAISPCLNAVSTERTASLSEKARFGNRLFSHFMFLRNDPDSMIDYRMYSQNNGLIKHYSTRPDAIPWGTKGPFQKDNWGISGLMRIGMVFGEKLLMCAIYLFVCLKALGGAFGLGEVTLYVSAATSFVGGFTSGIEAINDLRVNAKFLKDIFEFLDIPNKMYKGTLTTEKRSDIKYNVEFKNVSFKYPNSQRWVLKNVSVKFEVGTKLAVVGENGSGKSTFIKLLCRLYDPQEGEILLNGVNIKKYRYDEYIALFSVVFQDFWLMSHQLGQNVAGSCDVDDIRAVKCLEDAGFGERLRELPDKLDTWLFKNFDENGIEISEGERQKIAIARALYKRAPFIVLDEPTASLDPVAEADIYQKFDEIVGAKTAIYISHRLSSCRFSREILVFEDGEIIQRGTHDSLISEGGRYKELWDAQAKYYEKMKQYEEDKKYL